MLFLLEIITFAGVAYGSYTALAGILKLPTFAAEKAAQAYGKEDTLSMQFELFVQRLAIRLARHIKMDEYKYGKLEQELKNLGMEQTPEMYKATALVKSFLTLLLVIPCLFIWPIISIGIVIMAFLVYFQAENKLQEEIKKKREAIELELPRFCCTIKQELAETRDVLAILENYRRNATGAIRKELDITCADMRSGNYEAALTRFEARITSAPLSDIIRGLLGTLRGDDNTAYFEILAHDMDEMEIRRLEAEAAKQPGKIKKYLAALLGCMLLMYAVILIVYALGNMNFR
ncbi:hypothetical protein [[Clostridium] polysaccharolyticum]|uniref:Flp pilus assembly protein TadB n=1 Tax=[Clostridium] polysaccharolyticum TaxID=29364 RepID=A0A1H9Y8Z4_9FIRM|nr:hypothetical protein [[Clostridium] polysaccharolyticum]SES65295.1 hypothetical protein SAMN04487772_101220 [[Clostridium] polysaccharolyticum]